MTLEQKVVSLETAKKLKEAGFSGDTERDWCLVRSHSGAGKPGKWCVASKSEQYDMEEYGSNVFDERIAAPDAQEIGEELPAHFVIEKFNSPSGSWWCIEKAEAVCEGHENEAEARAAAWLWLKENNLL